MNPAKPSSKGIELTTEFDFRLGQLLISPSTCRVHGIDGEIRIEPRVMEVLVTLWRSAGRTMTRDHLVESCWAGRTISEDAVARVIAKIRQLAQTGGETHFVVETIPKVGFRLVPTPPMGPIQRGAGEAEVGSDTSATAERLTGSLAGFVDFPRWNRKTKWVATGWALASVAAATLLVVWRWGFTLSTAIPIQSGQVTLTQFAVAQPDAISERLSRELGEGVTQFLTESGLPPVGTRPRGDASPGSTRGEFEVGGSIRRERDDYVVNIWIRDFASSTTLWSSRLSRGAGDFAGLGEDVGDAVATTLKCALDQRKGAPRPLEARQLSLFLSACSALANGPDALEATGRLVQSAPSVPGAHALRAIALADYASDIDTFDSEALAGAARAAAARAIELNPNTALAHLALGLLSDSKRRFAERERHLLRALELDPNLIWARLQYVLLLQEVGRVRAAGNIAHRIQDSRDHFVRGALPRLTLLQAQLGERPTAQRLMDRLDRRKPGAAASTRWTTAMWWEDPSQITAEDWELGFQSMPTNGVVCFQKYLRKLTGAAEKPLHGLPAQCAGLDIDWRVRMLAREGDLDGAYELMERDVPVSRTTMFLFYPEMKAFRADPRFRPLAERLRLLAYWREVDQWPDSCSEERNDWCRS